MTPAQRDPSFDALVEHGAKLVARGVINLDDAELPSDYTGDESDADLQTAIKTELEDHDSDTDATDTTPDTPSRDPSDIDWPSLWSEFGFRPNQPASRTQAHLMLESSAQTPTNADGRGLLQEAIADDYVRVLGEYETKVVYRGETDARE